MVSKISEETRTHKLLIVHDQNTENDMISMYMYNKTNANTIIL